MRLALKIQTTSWKPSLPVLLLLVAGACGGPGAVSLQEEALEATGQGQALNTMNSLSVNGLSVNGLSVNGLSVNGLSVNGLNTSDFVGWFDSAPDTHDQVMRYLIRCAVSEGEVRTYTSPTTGLTRSWQGGLGLAPSWASGVPATVVEQQVVSACLAAHVNTYGYSVPISISGLKANGAPLPFSWQERLEYGVREACFFGNLFNGEGIYAGNDQVSLAGSLSSSRACGLSHVLSGQDPACPPILRVGACVLAGCQPHLTEPYYTQCTHNGVTYRPLTTRLRSVDVYVCGDGVCQVSESCGTGMSPDNCGLDCGACLQ